MHSDNPTRILFKLRLASKSIIVHPWLTPLLCIVTAQTLSGHPRQSAARPWCSCLAFDLMRGSKCKDEG